jgi:hypothetical protein
VFYGLTFLVSLALLAFCVLDCIATEPSKIRSLPKVLWLVVIAFIPTIGPVAWLLLGRPVPTRLSPGEARRAAPAGAPARPKRPLGPDDDPRFQEMSRHLIPPSAKRSVDKAEPMPEKSPEATARPQGEHGVNELRAWEEDLLRREEELKRRLQGNPPPAD